MYITNAVLTCMFMQFAIIQTKQDLILEYTKSLMKKDISMNEWE